MLDWLVLDLLLPTRPHPLSAQGTVTSLTRLGRDLVADFAVVALVAMLDATVGSVSSTQPAVQRVVLDPFSRGPAGTFLAQASELSHVAAHPIILNTNDQGSATMFHRCMRSVRAQCFHDNKRAERKGYHKDQSGLSATGGQCTHVVNGHVVVKEKSLHLWFLISLQASVCDEQLMSIGGEIALSGNRSGFKYIYI